MYRMPVIIGSSHSTLLDRGHCLLINGHYRNIIHHKKWGRPVEETGAFPSAERSCVVNMFIPGLSSEQCRPHV